MRSVCQIIGDAIRHSPWDFFDTAFFAAGSLLFFIEALCYMIVDFKDDEPKVMWNVDVVAEYTDLFSALSGCVAFKIAWDRYVRENNTRYSRFLRDLSFYGAIFFLISSLSELVQAYVDQYTEFSGYIGGLVNIDFLQSGFLTASSLCEFTQTMIFWNK
jgi:hypothetical protein